jgi:hypothetical protein
MARSPPSYVTHLLTPSQRAEVPRLVECARAHARFRDRVLRRFKRSRHLADAVGQYCRFLGLAQRHPNEFLVPTLGVDLVWHAHQLCPADYAADCQALLGRVLRHETTGLSDAVLTDGFRRTAERHRAAYGTAPPGAAGYGSNAAAQHVPVVACGGGGCGNFSSPHSEPDDPARDSSTPFGFNDGGAEEPLAVDASPWHTHDATAAPSTIDGWDSAAWDDHMVSDSFPSTEDGGWNDVSDGGGDSGGCGGGGGGDGGCGGGGCGGD